MNKNYDLGGNESGQSREEDVSSLVRRAFVTELARLSYLDFDTKKALGMQEGTK